MKKCTHLHTHKHTRKHTHTHTQASSHVHASTHTHTHTNTITRKRTHQLLLAGTCAYAYIIASCNSIRTNMKVARVQFLKYKHSQQSADRPPHTATPSKTSLPMPTTAPPAPAPPAGPGHMEVKLLGMLRAYADLCTSVT